MIAEGHLNHFQEEEGSKGHCFHLSRRYTGKNILILKSKKINNQMNFLTTRISGETSDLKNPIAELHSL